MPRSRYIWKTRRKEGRLAGGNDFR